MIAESSLESGFWQRARWGVALVLVLAVQLGFIFVLSDRSPVLPTTSVPSPAIHLTSGQPDELLLLSDPTLFVLPHRQGYSGETWLKVRSLTTTPFQWTEPIVWLRLAEDSLGLTFNHFMRTNSFATARFELMPPPEIARLVVEPEILIAGKSSVHLGGSLAKRGLRAPIDLPLWPYTDVIGPSKVQVLVDAAGNVISTLSLPSDNPSEPATRLTKEADQNAARLAKTARFKPSPKGVSEVTLGVMIFDWQVSAQGTNAKPDQ